MQRSSFLFLINIYCCQPSRPWPSSCLLTGDEKRSCVKCCMVEHASKNLTVLGLQSFNVQCTFDVLMYVKYVKTIFNSSVVL